MSLNGFTCTALAAAFALFPLPIQAQEQETMRLQFMTFPLTIEPLEVELVVGEGQTIKLKVPSNEFSETARVPRMASLVFGESVMDAENKPSFKVYGRGKAAAESKQLVLLLRRGKTMADGFEVRAIPSDIEHFGGGKLLFINASTTNIGGKAGHQPFALKPGGHTIIKPKLEANGRLAYVEFFYSRDGKPIPFFNSMWPVADNNRGIAFFYNDPNKQNKITLHSYREFLGEE